MGTDSSFSGKLTEEQVSNGIKWLDDIQSFYRERAIIEREYSQKLRYHLYPFLFLGWRLQKCAVEKVFREKGEKVCVLVSWGHSCHNSRIIGVCVSDHVDHNSR